MKVLHLSHAADARDGGIAFALADLVAAQRKQGVEVDWLTADQFVPANRDRLLLEAVMQHQPDLLHVHGLWRSPTRIAPRLAAAGLPLVIAPHGMLDSWALARSAWKKGPVMRLWEERALASAHCLQALCNAEVESIRALCCGAPLALIPNAVNPPAGTTAAEPLPEPPWAGLIPSGERVLLYFGRFHAKKGLEPLLLAWEAVSEQAARSGWWLVLVGYGELAASGRQRGPDPIPRTLTCGPAFDQLKQAVLSQASAFVLPSYSEGLPMAVLEAMAHGLPCLISTACNLPEAFSAGAAQQAEPSQPHLQATLLELFATPPAQLDAMGQAGQALVARHYAPGAWVANTQALYRWILGQGERPACVLA